MEAIVTIFEDWNRDLPGILARVSPDPDGQADPALYAGTTFKAEYLARIPQRDDLKQAVRTAVINKRAGGMGLISGRKAFQRPMKEGVELLQAIQDVYLDKAVSLA